MLREATLFVSEKIAERLGDALMENGALSVSLADADANNEAEEPLYGEPGLEPEIRAWKRSKLSFLVDENFDADDVAKKAFASLKLEPVALDSLEDVPDTDWVKVTQAQFGPTKVSDRLWIVPSWNEPPKPEAINIRLDPGVAFGTGSHPTTKLCLTWLDQNCKAGISMLDFGCGTGILAIAAAKLGATDVAGVDIDPQAVEAAKVNAAANNVLATFALPDAFKGRQFDIVVANILANPLKVLAPELIAKLNDTGFLVLSGVLSHQVDDLIRAYHEVDSRINLRVYNEEQDWVCLVAQKGEPKEM